MDCGSHVVGCCFAKLYGQANAFYNAREYDDKHYRTGVGRKLRRHIDNGRIRVCGLLCLTDGIENGHVKNCLSALAGSYAADDVRSIGQHLFGVEFSLMAGNTLHEKARILID